MMAFELDPDSLSDLYRAHSQSMLVFFTRRCYDAQLGVDLVAETFARAYSKRSSFRGVTSDDAEAWVWRIARNALTDALRHGRAERRALDRLGVQPPQLDDGELARVEELAGLGDLRVALGRALAELVPEQREALRLKVILELDYPAVALRLGVSEVVARARVSRALRVLRANLDFAEGVG